MRHGAGRKSGLVDRLRHGRHRRVSVGDAVTAEQMRALFGTGMHPLAAQRLEQLGAADLTDTNNVHPRVPPNCSSM